ncbi:hypothetical protein EDB80DRAFT_383921 [Ilyonectria destructans]|nr:hypothetical protein EDB80DRAFT_383921 [Ilyonectria destructans]
MPRFRDVLRRRDKPHSTESKDSSYSASVEITESESRSSLVDTGHLYMVKQTADLPIVDAPDSAPAKPISQVTSENAKILSFWARAYQEILDDQDRQIKKILEAYDVLLERAQRTDSETSGSTTTLPTDTQSQSLDGDWGRDDASPEVENEDNSSESELSNSEPIHPRPPAQRMVGNEGRMSAVVKVKLEEMQQKEWVLKWHGHVFNVREEVTRIVGIVQKMSGFVNQAAGLNPYSGLAWAGVCVLLPIITSDTDERQTAIDGVSKATQLVARYKTVEEDYLHGMHGKHEDFEKVLVAMYREIALFYIKAACYFARSTMKRMLRGVAVLDGWKSNLANLTKADEECQAFVTSLGLSASLKKGDRILEKLSKIETGNQINSIKSWLLSDIDVDKQHLDKQDKLGSEFSNSGRWLLDSHEFTNWEESTSGQFWISGAIGTGKTSLVSIVVDRIRLLGVENVAFFYYSVDTSKTLQTPSTTSRLEQILRGLVGQLAMSPDKQRVAEEVEIAFDEALKRGTLQPAPLGWEGAKNLLIKIISSRRNTTVIIDGIDEFPEFTTLLKELKAIYDAVKLGKLRLLLSSQTVVPVSAYFPSTTLMVAGGEKSKPDMKAFIERKVKLFRSDHSKALTQMVADDMVDTLSEKAEGMFKWADLCLKQVLYDDDTLHIQENWKSVKAQHFRGLLVGLVIRYEQLYKKSLSKGYSKQRTSQLENDAERILLWVLGAKAQLRWKEYSALHPEGDAWTGPVSKICQNFLHISENAMIAASHSSVWDYVSLKATGNVRNFIKCAEGDEDQERRSASILEEAKNSTTLLAQKKIARDCLEMLVDSDDSAFSADEQTQSPLLQYARRNWFKHVDALTEDGIVPDDLQNQVKAMFESRCIKRWISAYDSHTSRPRRSPDPLYYATLLGYSNIVKLLLETGASSRTGGRLGQALQLASFQGKTIIVRDLLKDGVNVNQADEVLGTPLQAAIAGGQRELANILMDDYGVDVNASGASFGNALQMALAMDDQDLAASLRAHGAKHNGTNRRDRIWDNAWHLAQTSKLDEAIKVLHMAPWERSEEKSTTPKLPVGLDRRLEVLAICILHRHKILHHPRRVDHSERVRRSKHPQKLNVDEEEIWQTVIKQVSDTEVGTVGFIPATCTWLLFASFRFGSDIEEDEPTTMLQNIVDTVYSILRQHETFIQTFPENIPALGLEELLSNLFGHAIFSLINIAQFQMKYAPTTRMKTFAKIIVRDRLKSFERSFLDRLNGLRDLHKEAVTLEDNTKSTAALHQILSEYNDRTTSELHKMSSEIAGLKEDISVLTRNVELLLSLHQKLENANLKTDK